MSFETYRAKVLDLLVVAIKYDNAKAKAGLCDPKLTPTAEQQKEYMEPLLQEMEFDFMPKRGYQVYHVVCTEWFNQWKRWVGLPVKAAQQDAGQTEESLDLTADQRDAQDAPQLSAQEKFKNLNRKQRKQQKHAAKAPPRSADKGQQRQGKATPAQQPYQVSHSKESDEIKPSPPVIERRPPGPINSQAQLANFCVTQRPQDLLPFNDDPLDNKVLKPPTEISENEQFVLLNDQCFQYLYGIYGGTDVRRHSVEVESIEDQDAEADGDAVRSSTRDGTVRDEDVSMQDEGQVASAKKAKPVERAYSVELHLRRLRIHLVPQMNFFPTYNKMPFTVYISRTATVGELHMKIAQALLSRTTLGHSVLQLLSWSRMWKVD